MSHVSGVTIEKLDKADVNKAPKIDDPIRNMVDHSAYEYLHHIDILDKLVVYKNENIIISLVLAYGNKAYAEK